MKKILIMILGLIWIISNTSMIAEEHAPMPVPVIIEAKHAKLMQKYKIGENFKGFAYSSVENKETLKVVNLLDGEKRLMGFWFSNNANGNLKEIGPILAPTSVEFDVCIWALDNYFEGKIKFDVVWSIFHTANPHKLNDKLLILNIIDLIEPHLDGKPSLKEELITPNDDLFKIVQKFHSDTTEAFSLYELKIRLEKDLIKDLEKN